MLSISGPGRYLGCIVRGSFQLLVVVASMSCSSRVKKSQQQGRRLSNTDAAGMKKNNSRRSLLVWRWLPKTTNNKYKGNSETHLKLKANVKL